ncbi:MAG: amino acid permease [Endomicrobium sp.]|nr:amino acid permease [Endomicrobium sp.]
MKELENINLKRNLTNRHIQFISLGGAIGTGLFLCAATTINAAGPSVLLGYLITGIIVFLIMRQLGEMVTNEPVAGSAAHFAHKYWGKFPGFLAGWNHYVEYILSGMVELTAIAAYTQYWFPNLPTWQITLFFFLLVNVANLLTVKAFGEVEFLLSTIKVATVCLIILIGGYILLFNPGLIPGASIKNLWHTASGGGSFLKGFFPHGFIGFILAFPIIIFSFDGIELIGLTAAETADPQKTIPKAIKQVALNILLFYLGSLFVLLCLYHWSTLTTVDSPFVIVFDRIGLKYAASILNFILLTAALSVYNSCIYSNSRMLYGLALQENAPEIFTKTNKKGVPSPAIIFSSVLTFLIVPLNYFVPNWSQALEIVMSFALVGIILNWGIIVMAHLKYRQCKEKNHEKTLFTAPFYPWSNYIAVGFLTFILCSSVLSDFANIKKVIAVPIWILVVWIWYKFSKSERSSK